VTITFLTPDLAKFKCDLDGGKTFLSAMRLWEHGVLGQVNVTNIPISPRSWASQINRHIDVIECVNGVETIVCSLQDICDGRATLKGFGRGSDGAHSRESSLLSDGGWQNNPAVLALQRDVGRFLYHLSHRLAERGSSLSFWPGHEDSKPQHNAIGIPGLHLKLTAFLMEKCPGRHRAGAWIAMLESGQRQSFKQEELHTSGLISWLSEQLAEQSTQRYTAQDLIKKIDYSAVKLSAIPVLQHSDNPIKLHRQADQTTSRAKKLLRVQDGSKPQIGQRRFLHQYDPVLGYRVEGIEHETVWGKEVHWQAVTFRGQPIKNQHGVSLLTKPEVASQLAIHHAQRMLPKKEPKDVWIDYSMTGGENYREWLVTLPWFPVSHEENHFSLRNVLIHIRCDERQDSAGRKILFLQEVQSDWAQSWAQRQRERDDTSPPKFEIPQPPFAREWPSLAVKLMLLHSVTWNFDGIAWATGDMQVELFGRENAWFRTLYDQMLPKLIAQAITPHGGVVAELPMRCHCEQQAVLGVLLSEEVKTSILFRGFPAWG